jgi:hypothetical protein
MKLEQVPKCYWEEYPPHNCKLTTSNKQNFKRNVPYNKNLRRNARWKKKESATPNKGIVPTKKNNITISVFEKVYNSYCQ